MVPPENVNNNKTGYHAECYRKFTTLGRNVPSKNGNVDSKSTYKIKNFSAKWFIINRNNARNMHLLYQERQKTQRQYTEADFSGNGILWRKDQEICNSPRGSSTVIHIGKYWFCRQRNTLLWRTYNKQLQSKFKKQAKIKR